MTLKSPPRYRPALGSLVGAAHPRIAITMTPEMFRVIDRGARQHDLPFAEQTRRLLVLGIGLEEAIRKAGVAVEPPEAPSLPDAPKIAPAATARRLYGQ